MNKKTTKKSEKVKEEKKDEITDVAVIPSVESAIVVPETFKSKFTKSQVDLIKATIAKGASDDELKMFLYVCQRTGLDPFTKQIHLVPRWDSRLGKEVRMPIVGIDGLRSIAERTDNYAGNDDPIYDDEAKPNKATVSVYKIVQGQRVAFTATARWSQYCPPENQAFMWNKMPHLMLGKCAEALALRKAFPAVMSGLYVAEEMAQAGVVVPGQSTGGQESLPENPFEKAKSMIKAIGKTGIAGLGEFKVKLAKSEKYTEAEKNQLSKMIDERLVELTPHVNVPPENGEYEGDL